MRCKGIVFFQQFQIFSRLFSPQLYFFCVIRHTKGRQKHPFLLSIDKLTTFLRLLKSGIIFCQCLYIMRPTAAQQPFFRSLKSAFCLSTSPKAPCWRFPILAMTMYEQARHCSFGLTKTLACLNLKNIIQNTARTLLLADVKFYLQTAVRAVQILYIVEHLAD